jgi:hypothetical protein
MLLHLPTQGVKRENRKRPLFPVLSNFRNISEARALDSPADALRGKPTPKPLRGRSRRGRLRERDVVHAPGNFCSSRCLLGTAPVEHGKVPLQGLFLPVAFFYPPGRFCALVSKEFSPTSEPIELDEYLAAGDIAVHTASFPFGDSSQQPNQAPSEPVRRWRSTGGSLSTPRLSRALLRLSSSAINAWKRSLVFP